MICNKFRVTRRLRVQKHIKQRRQRSNLSEKCMQFAVFAEDQILLSTSMIYFEGVRLVQIWVVYVVLYRQLLSLSCLYIFIHDFATLSLTYEFEYAFGILRPFWYTITMHSYSISKACRKSIMTVWRNRLILYFVRRTFRLFKTYPLNKVKTVGMQCQLQN